MMIQGLKYPATNDSATKTLPEERQNTVTAIEKHEENQSLIARAQSLFNRMVGVEETMPDCFSEQTFWESSSRVLEVPAAWRRDASLRKNHRIH